MKLTKTLYIATVASRKLIFYVGNRPEKSSAARRQPAAMDIMPLPKPTADKNFLENPLFQRLPEIPSASGGETFSWPVGKIRQGVVPTN